MKMLPGVIAAAIVALTGGAIPDFNPPAANAMAFEEAVMHTTLANVSPFTMGKCVAQFGLPPGVHEAPALSDGAHSKAEHFIEEVKNHLQRGDSMQVALRQLSVKLTNTDMKDVLHELRTMSSMTQDMATCLADPVEAPEMEEMENPGVVRGSHRLRSGMEMGSVTARPTTRRTAHKLPTAPSPQVL